MKNLLTGLFRAARKRTMTTDNDMGAFRDKLNELVEKKDELSEEEINVKVEELKGITKDLPGDEDKAKLDRFLEDFKAVKEQDVATAKEAAGMVADLFEKLDTEAMQDVPEQKEEVKEEEKTEEKVEETEAPAKEETTEEKVVEETKAEDTKDSDNSDYTLEEIYQFIKKRMAEDGDNALSGLGKDTVETSSESDANADKAVCDHAPFIPVTMNKTEATGSLCSMFASIKKGER